MGTNWEVDNTGTLVKGTVPTTRLSGNVSGLVVVGQDGTADENFTCDGTADNIQIQAALNTGNSVLVKHGIYELNSNLSFSAAGQMIIGEGRDLTILENKTAGGTCITVNQARCTILDITFRTKTGSSGDTSAIATAGGAADLNITRVRIYDFGGYGLRMGGGGHITLYDCIIQGNDLNTGTKGEVRVNTYPAELIDCRIGDSTTVGVSVENSKCSIQGSFVNGDIVIDRSNQTRIENNLIIGDIVLDDSISAVKQTIITGNDIDGSITATGSNGIQGIISNNTITTNIALNVAGCLDWTIIGNYMNSGSISVRGDYCTIQGNHYVGSITTRNDYIAIIGNSFDTSSAATITLTSGSTTRSSVIGNTGLKTINSGSNQNTIHGNTFVSGGGGNINLTSADYNSVIGNTLSGGNINLDASSQSNTVIGNTNSTINNLGGGTNQIANNT